MITIKVKGMDKILKVTNGLSDIRMQAIKIKQATQISKRAAGPLGTPGATPRKEGNLRKSAHLDPNPETPSFGYVIHYAPHVEFGHKIRGGGRVEGQRFLQKNKEIQEPIYKEDVEKTIERILKGGGQGNA